MNRLCIAVLVLLGCDPAICGDSDLGAPDLAMVPIADLASADDLIPVQALDMAIVPDMTQPADLLPTTPAPGLKIMPLGDSLTEGYDYPGGYRFELWLRFRLAGVPFAYVGSLLDGPVYPFDQHHEGHGGFTIDNIRMGIDTWIAAEPDRILLMIGTNDCIQQLDIANAGARLGALLDYIHSIRPAIKFVVATIPPMVATIPGSVNVDPYNAQIPGVVAARPWTTLADVHAVITLANVVGDGVHLNPTGFAEVGDVMWDALVGVQ